MPSSLRRYSNTPVFGLQSYYGTSYTIPTIRENIENGNIRFKELIIKESIRLDTLAGIEYGDGKLWWIIAAASSIGWATAVMPGTVIRIPEINDLSKYIG